MPHETQPQNNETTNEPRMNYDIDSAQAGWNSPERAQALVERFVREGSNVLDIGIGTGQAIAGYPEKGAKIVGIDKDEQMLRTAQEATGDAGLMRFGDINKDLPVSDLEGQVDVVQAIGVLEFAEDIEDVFKQIVPTLNKNGVLVFTIETTSGNGSGEKSEHFPGADTTIYRHSPEEIHEILASNGLRLLHEEAYDGYDRGDLSKAKVPYSIYLAQK